MSHVGLFFISLFDKSPLIGIITESLAFKMQLILENEIPVFKPVVLRLINSFWVKFCQPSLNRQQVFKGQQFTVKNLID